VLNIYYIKIVAGEGALKSWTNQIQVV